MKPLPQPVLEKFHAADHVVLPVDPAISALQMSVAEKGDLRFEIGKNVAGIGDGDEVFVFIDRRTVNELEGVDAERSARQAAKVVEIDFGELRHGPESRGARRGVEPFQIFETCAAPVVIAPNDGMQVGAGPIEHRVRIGGVAGKVAAANDAVVLASRVFEDGVERFFVAVEIADDEIAHDDYADLRRARVISGSAPIRTGTVMVPMPAVT